MQAQNSFSDLFLSQDSLGKLPKQKSSISLEFLDETFQTSKTFDRQTSKRKSTLNQATLNSYSAIYETPMKIILVGDSNVGKSCIIKRFTSNEFNGTNDSTIGIAYNFKKISLKNTSPSLFDSSMELSPSFNNLNLNIWDTAGGERFRTLTHLFFNGAKGVMFVMDLTKRKSFHSLQYWMEQVKTELEDNVVKCLFCNKSDMDIREVTSEEIASLCETWGIHYFEGSAKTGSNVESAFQYVAEEIHENITNSLNKIFSSCQIDAELSLSIKNLKYNPFTSKEVRLMNDNYETSKMDDKCAC